MAPKKDTAIGDLKLAQAETLKGLETQDRRLREQEARLKKIEEKVKSIDDSLRKINSDLIDLKRQNSKVCITLSGPDLPRRLGTEDATKIFIEQVKRKYDVTIDQDELATVHRLPNGGLITKFIKQHVGSGYHRLAVRRGMGSRNPNESLRVYANVQLTRYDSRIRFFAAIAKKVGTILFYDTLLSGRIGLVVPIPDSDKTKHITVNDYEDIKPYLTQPVLEEIEKANKKRKARRNKKSTKDDDEHEDGLLAEMNDIIGVSQNRTDGDNDANMEVV